MKGVFGVFVFRIPRQGYEMAGISKMRVEDLVPRSYPLQGPNKTNFLGAKKGHFFGIFLCFFLRKFIHKKIIYKYPTGCI